MCIGEYNKRQFFEGCRSNVNDYYPTGYQGGYGGGQQGENDSPRTFRRKENNYPSYNEISFPTLLLLACLRLQSMVN